MCENMNESVFEPNEGTLQEGIIISMNDYKRMQTSEILLHVLLTTNISAYGSCSNIIDAVRQTYADLTGEKVSGTDNAK